MAAKTKTKPATHPTALDAARAEVAAWTTEAKHAFPERDGIVDAMVLAGVARTNVILYGPPGTAKSALARAFGDAIEGNVFDLLFTRYTTPSEFMGPTDVQALKLGHQKRVAAGYAPEAHVFFIDEGFKANSACLNSMLTLVNEHAWHDDGQLKPANLRVAVLASNEFPEDNDNLGAFDDRFPLRFDVRPLQNPDNFRAVISGGLPKPTAKIDTASLELLQMHAESIDVADDAIEALWKVREKLDEKSIYVSDRKLVVAANLLRAWAAITGAPRVTSAHLGLLENVLWLRPEQKPIVREIVRQFVASWVTDIQQAIEVIDEQEASMATAIKGKGNVSATGTAIAKVGQKLKELNKNVLEPLKHNPEAVADVKRLQDRVDRVLERGRKALATLM
jgi:MoxR-like ATPase